MHNIGLRKTLPNINRAARVRPHCRHGLRGQLNSSPAGPSGPTCPTGTCRPASGSSATASSGAATCPSGTSCCPAAWRAGPASSAASSPSSSAARTSAPAHPLVSALLHTDSRAAPLSPPPPPPSARCSWARGLPGRAWGPGRSAEAGAGAATASGGSCTGSAWAG
eukprot:2864252-Rhodomonas_salina.8